MKTATEMKQVPHLTRYIHHQCCNIDGFAGVLKKDEYGEGRFPDKVLFGWCPK